MPMKKLTAQFHLTGGLNGRVAPQQLQAPELVQATNIYRQRSGEWTKRNGFHLLPAKYVNQGFVSNHTPTSIRAMGSRDGNLVILDKSHWWERTEGLAGLRALSDTTDPLEHRLATHRLVDSFAHGAVGPISLGADAQTVDVAFGNGYEMAVWSDGNASSYAAIIDQATGQVHSRIGLGGGRRPKVVHTTSGHFCVFQVIENGGGTPSQLHIGRWSTTGTNGPVQISTGTVVVNDMMSTSVGTPWYDVQVNGANGNILIAYRSSAPSVRAIEWNPSTNVASIAVATVVAADDAANAIGWVQHDWGATTSPRLATAVNSVTGVVYRTLNAATLAQTSAVTVLASPGDVASITGVRDPSTTDAFLLWELRPVDTTLTSVVEGHTSPVSSKTFLSIGCLTSKPFQVDGSTWHVGVSMPWELQPGYFVVPVLSRAILTTDQVMSGLLARVLPGNGVSLPPVRNSLGHVAQITTTKHAFPCLRIEDFQINTAGMTLFRRPALAEIDSGSALPRPVSYSRGMIAPGSACRSWAGDIIHEAGFLLAPERPTVTAVAGGGMANGTYQYRLCFAFEDGEGRTWRSAPSPPASVTLGGGNNQVSLTVKEIAVTSLAGSMATKRARIEVYRTLANGTTFLRRPAVGTIVRISGWASTQTFGDNAVDADIASNLPLYTDGGELFNEAAPPCVSMALVGSRIVAVPAEDRTAVIASKEIQSGQGVGFHPDLRVPIVSDGDNYAVAAMEGRTVVFKRQAIYVLTGDWPNAVGGGSLPIAQRVAVGFGTINEQSVRESNEGVWFQDPKKGMCLLTRGLDVVQPGKPIQGGDIVPVVGVEVAEDDEQIRVAATGSPMTVSVYDYLEKQWFRWQAASMPAGVTCSATVGGVYYVGLSNGRVAYYNTASFQDNGGSLTNYDPLMEMRFDLAGKEGVQRVYKVGVTGQFHDAVTLLGSLASSYGALVAKPGLVLAAEGDGLTFVVHFRPERQQCTTLYFRLTFSSSTQGARFQTVSIEYGVRDGMRKLGAASMT